MAAWFVVLLLAGCASAVRWGPPPREGSRPAGGAGTALVQPGDTLYSIAFRHNLDYHDLAAWNGIDRSYTIYPGQRLRLTPPGARRAPTRSVSRPTATPSVQTPVVPVQPTPAPRQPVETSVAGSFDPDHWRWPASGRVVTPFSPGDGSKGIDIAGSAGEPVVAAASGKVVYSGSALKGYGELIIIKHSDRYLSAYGYNRKRLVEEGQTVHAGQTIAEMGEGPEQRVELHFEIRDRGNPVDPLSLLPRR